MSIARPSLEQQALIMAAWQGRSALVDACIGSGKTSAIQKCCEWLSAQRKRVLYLTYNRLLKLDAQGQISAPGAFVTNYHGYAYGALAKAGLRTNMRECLEAFTCGSVPAGKWDTLVLDEYQDIDTQIAGLLEKIKAENPGLQILAVGDMDQKVYDRTRLDARRFIHGFLPDGYDRYEFTQCFRLGPDLANELGAIWGKRIVGVNPRHRVLEMDYDDAVAYLGTLDPSDILVLGANAGTRVYLQNDLEARYRHKFNKRTVWSKISEGEGSATQPTPDTAIFTTYDGCKGMERNTCVVCDWTYEYWRTRLDKSDSDAAILRNIFCVAASRGKRETIFLRQKDKTELSFDDLRHAQAASFHAKDQAISRMFDFKFDEDTEAAYRLLRTRAVRKPGRSIDCPTADGMIDLSPCLGIMAESCYFKGYDLDAVINRALATDTEMASLAPSMQVRKAWTDDQKILFLAAVETRQLRYERQVGSPFVAPEYVDEMRWRLATEFSGGEDTQVPCMMRFSAGPGKPRLFSALGMADVLANGAVYELKFVSELAHVHFLQCACYMCALKLDKGYLWNIRDGAMHEITIPDRPAFIRAAVAAATKGAIRNGWLM